MITARRTTNRKRMRNITLTTALLLAGMAAQAQVVFQSGLENWTAGVPTDMFGSKTSFVADSIFQETTNVHGGTSAVRLQLSSGTHRRFTTQALAVTAGTAYDISFWVRGRGRVRTNIYDGRPDASGYGTYNPYVDLTDGSTWQQVTQSVTCTNSGPVGEFIFSVISTVGPEHIVIDDITISVGEAVVPTVATISEIQTTATPDGASPLADELVQTTGIITGVVLSATSVPTSFFIQDGTGEYSGLYVFGSPGTAVQGDLVTVVGIVTEYDQSGSWAQSFTELTGLQSVTVVSSGNALPAAEVLNATEASSEPWEGVLVKVLDLQCQNLPDGSNNFQWNGSNWLGSILVNDLFFDSAPVVGSYYSVTGLLNYSFNEWKLEPRDQADIEIGVGIGELSGTRVSVYPNPAQEQLTIELASLEAGTLFNVIDANGRSVMNGTVNTDRHLLDVSSVSNGLYALTLTNSKASWSTRILVQH